MTVPSERSPASIATFRAQKAEELLGSIVGVISTRVVLDDDGGIEEIHVLSTSDVSPKQAVRNVESALLAHLDLAVDHRRISVAQAEPGAEVAERRPSGGPPAPGPRDPAPPPPASVREPSNGPRRRPRISPVMPTDKHEGAAESTGTGRFLFVGHQVTSQRSQRVETRVTLEWRGQQYEGSAWTPDLPKPRLEAMADATLRAMEQAIQSDDDEGRWPDGSLNLEGVSLVDAFGRQYVLVSVHALQAGRTTALAGAVTVGDNAEASVALATLQATDRRIRGMIEEIPQRRPRRRAPDPAFGDPFDIWG